MCSISHILSTINAEMRSHLKVLSRGGCKKDYVKFYSEAHYRRKCLGLLSGAWGINKCTFIFLGQSNMRKWCIYMFIIIHNVLLSLLFINLREREEEGA